MNFSAKELAIILNGTVEGDETVSVSTYAKIEEGKPGALSFLSNPKYEHYIYDSEASIILVNNNLQLSRPTKATLVRVPDAYLALATLLQMVEKQEKVVRKGHSWSAKIARTAKIGKNCYIGPFVYIGEHVVIGDNTQIYSHCAIETGARIGSNTILYNGVVVYNKCMIGNRCILHANSVIGADGFGFARKEDGSWFKMPQNGNVIIEDDVEIGATTTIDRGSMGPTIIHKGVKIDNQVQVAHNVEIGSNTAMAACSGIAGSTKVGEDCIFAGMVGVAGHIQIANKTIVGAFSGVTKSINEEGATYHGPVAIPAIKNKRSFAVYKNLPELQKTVYELQKEIEALKAQLNK